MSTTKGQATDISFESGDAREVIGDGIIEIYGWVGTESLLIRMSLIEVVLSVVSDGGVEGKRVVVIN